MNKRRLIILCFLCWPYLASAETIVLSTGETIEGDLLEKTDAYIKVDTGEATAIYFMDEIMSIGGVKTVSEEILPASPDPGKQASQDLVADSAATLVVSQEEITPEVTLAADVIEPALSEKMPSEEVVDAQGDHPGTSVVTEPPSQKDALTVVQPQTAQEYFKRGQEAMSQMDFTQGLADFTKAITLDSQLAQAYVNRGFIYYKLKEFGSAWADVHKAQEMGQVVDQEFIEALKKLSGRDG